MKHYLKKILKVLTVKTFTSVERLEIEIEKLKEKGMNCDTAYYTSRGKEKAFIDRIGEINTYISQLKTKAKKICDSDDTLLLRIMKEIEIQSQQLEFANKNLELSKRLTEKLYSQKVMIDTKISDFSNKLDMFKQKEDFTKSIKEFQSVVGFDSNSEFEDIEKQININFNALEFKFEDLEKEEISLNKILEDSDDEKLKQFKKIIVDDSSILNYELQNENFTYSVDIEYVKNVNSLIKKINNRFNNKKSKLSEYYLFEAFSDNSTKIYERSIHFYEGYSNDLYVPLNPIESDILKTFKLLGYRWSDILYKKRYYNYKNGYIPHKLQPHIKNIEISD